MGVVVLFAAVSLDGYVGRDDDVPGPLFDWYGNGDVEVTLSDANRVFTVTPQTADFLRTTASRTAVMVCGRRLFDITNGWEGVPPNGEHVVVVTHRPADDWPHAGTAPFTFVPDVRTGIEQAQALAGDRDVTVTAGDVGGQALRAGLVDRVVLSLVPVVLGSGRPFFGAAGDPLRGPGRRPGEAGDPPGVRRAALSGKRAGGPGVAPDTPPSRPPTRRGA